MSLLVYFAHMFSVSGASMGVVAIINPNQQDVVLVGLFTVAALLASSYVWDWFCARSPRMKQ